MDDVGILTTIVEELLSSVEALGPAAPVYVTGWSNGGYMATLLATQQPRPAWLKGVAPFSGHQYDFGASSGSLPILMQHGVNDPIVRPEGCCAASSSLRCARRLDLAWCWS